MPSKSDHIPPSPPAEAMAKAHLLVVEDEPTIRQLFATLLEAAGYSVAQAVDGFAALEEIRRQRPALILSDLNMPRMTGFELLSIIRRRFPNIHVIAMSGAFSGDSIPDGVAADAFYEKSGRGISTLVDVIESFLETLPAQPEDCLKPPRRSLEAEGDRQPMPATAPVALWVTRRGTPIEGPYTLLTCPECLRSFPHFAGESTTMHLLETDCIFCGARIAFALLDPLIAHHQGFGPGRPAVSAPAPIPEPCGGGQ